VSQRVRLLVRQTFFGVGQGLFAEGRIYTSQDPPAHFRWVYDCGTNSGKSLIDRALKKFKAAEDPVSTAGAAAVDLVCLSHFDSDHVNGLVRLLRISAVDTLLLPYMPLWQRLLLAFAEGVDTQQPLFNFFMNPVDYISGLNTQLERIILVPSGRGDGPPDPGDARAPSPDVESPLTLEPDLGGPSGRDQVDDAGMFNSSKGVAVQWLRPGGRLRVANLWEFVPYNDADFIEKAGQQFRRGTAKWRTRLLAANTDQARTTALIRIKKVYDRAFGHGSVQRNVISLFLYSSALPRSDLKQAMLLDRFTIGNRTGTLYTGDGYLDTPERLRRLIAHYRKSRLGNLGCLQVMHHGAKGNWHKGVAAKLNPQMSVFSSDPARGKLQHPHAEVLRDFWMFGPVQVHQEVDLEMDVILYEP
jgi:hypothetical protein